uniref:Metallo-beta-lactamase domain-containing protein n=1 Tax=Alexandrium catenella TaxID=2925 RepID=A0A7S1S579_ALECA|mmetsp:Transcript_86632/g.230130  ORF Transcript_86632/g.230130 Transcript_86632/m.230130 type:complete len:149 (+) Transcript_86632:283-729(+)
MSDHASWKRAFPDAIQVAHCADCPRGSMDVELEGTDPWDDVGGFGGFRAYHVPGHSEGSVFYQSLEHSAVFTGDSIGLWTSRPTGFGAFSRSGRERQAQSLREYVRTAPFCCAVLPGHGRPEYFEGKQELRKFFDVAADGLVGGRSRL